VPHCSPVPLGGKRGARAHEHIYVKKRAKSGEVGIYDNEIDPSI